MGNQSSKKLRTRLRDQLQPSSASVNELAKNNLHLHNSNTNSSSNNNNNNNNINNNNNNNNSEQLHQHHSLPHLPTPHPTLIQPHLPNPDPQPQSPLSQDDPSAVHYQSHPPPPPPLPPPAPIPIHLQPLSTDPSSSSLTPQPPSILNPPISDVSQPPIPLSTSNSNHHHHHNNNNNNNSLLTPSIPEHQPQPQHSSSSSSSPFNKLVLGQFSTSAPHPNPNQLVQTNTIPSSTSNSSAFDVDEMINRLLDVGYSTKSSKSVCLKNSEITAITSVVREVLLNQPTLIELSPPVKIVGDVHGQFTDLIRLFEMCGFPPSSNYLFLGDYVDRGKQSLETILLLLCYKIKYPENFFLLRGNHECANVTRVYGFYDECKRRCNIKIWKTFIDVFNCLPISAVVASKIFCVHGGLSPSLTTMDDIRKIQRPTDVPDYGLLNDLLWSDPSDTATDWEDNERGVSYCFGKSVIAEFLARYDFDLICRAHMVVEDGYEFWNERTLVTIFSAPNYCGEFDNFGAVMSVSEDLLCAFELLKPLDGAALKKEMQKKKRQSVMGSFGG